MKPADQAAGFKIIIHYLFGTLLHWNFIETKPIAQRLHAAYSKFISDPLSIDILRDGFFGSRDGNRDTFKPYLVDEFVSAGYSKEKSTKLAEECSCFIDHLIGQFEANSNYVLSQEFVFLIESFFENSDIRWDYSVLLKRTNNTPESR